MNSLWDDEEAASFEGEIGQRIYTSRLLGRDPTLVLHGGGNTSVKLTRTNLFGEPEDLLYVKGSGWDLKTIEVPGFTPVRMDALLKLARLESLSDAEMARQLRLATVEPSAPSPSVEAILHAILPYRFIDHTHADDVITLTNTPTGSDRIREVYGDRIVLIPYVMPGFALSKLVAELFPRSAHESTLGLVLMNHGLVTFGATARESYERTIALVGEAQSYLKHHKAWTITFSEPTNAAIKATTADLTTDMASLRLEISRAAGDPMILTHRSSPELNAFVRHHDVERLAKRGPATPDHVIRTKCVPMIGRDVATFIKAYSAYFESNARRYDAPLTMLDPAPRVILDPELGMVAVGRTAIEAQVVADIYEHTVKIICRAESLDQWHALPAEDVFDVEYWDLEQMKLRAGRAAKPFTGEVVLITGAASGIGKACVEAFRSHGAAVVGLDIDPSIEALSSTDVLGICADVTDEAAIRRSLATTAARFGGLDMLVLNAGVFPPSTPITKMPLELWQRAMHINADANMCFLREAHPLLCRAPQGGRVVVVASKNVPAPGPGAAAYSASKAALTQLVRVAALEWGRDKIRINVLHPDAVFDTGLWNAEILTQRAISYGLTVEQYKTKNVLGKQVTSAQVAAAAAELCGPSFAVTTGMQVAVDGGNERVI